jgi:hypothetical protein
LRDPALRVVYTIAGRRCLVDAQDAWSAQAVSNLFTGWFLTPHASNGNASPDATVRIRCGAHPPRVPEGLVRFEVFQGGVCHTDGQTFHLDFNGSLIIIGPGLAREVEVWVRERYDFGSKILAQIISQAFSAALRRCGLFEFHSAGVVPPRQEKAILMAGASGSGKSTLTLQLAACGWSYLSDDTLLLDKDKHGIAVHGLRRFFALTADTMAAVRLPQLTPPAVTGPFKERVTPRDLFPAGQIQRSRPGAIFFPIITHETESRVERLTAAETMTRLLRLCPWAGYDKPTAGEHLGVLGDLARESIAFDFLAGTDLLEDKTLAAGLCLGYART